MFEFIKKIFFKSKKKIKEKKVVYTTYKNAFDINFWLKYNSHVRHDMAMDKAKILKKAFVFNDPNTETHESIIVSVFIQAGSKSQISLISYIYNQLYKIDLLEELQKNISDDIFKIITDFIKNLKD
jgi:phosphotransferase system  glucose/maltose/N-acetylglucosamine-specific IIC component